MNKYIILSFAASCALMLGACGNSGNDNNAPQPQVDSGGLNNQCVNNANQCAGSFDEGQQLGLTHMNNQQGQFQGQQGQGHWTPFNAQDYYQQQRHGGQGGYQAPSYNHGGQQYTSVCGCPQGTKPVLYEGATMCADTTIFQQSRETLNFGLRFEKGQVDDIYASYDFLQITDRDTALTQPEGSCHQTVTAACNPYKPYQCQNYTDSYGNPILAKCQPKQGYNVGVCVPTQQYH